MSAISAGILLNPLPQEPSFFEIRPRDEDFGQYEDQIDFLGGGTQIERASEVAVKLAGETLNCQDDHFEEFAPVTGQTRSREYHTITHQSGPGFQFEGDLPEVAAELFNIGAIDLSLQIEAALEPNVGIRIAQFVRIFRQALAEDVVNLESRFE